MSYQLPIIVKLFKNNQRMKKVKVYPSHFEVSAAELPCGNELRAIKLFQNQAVQFDYSLDFEEALAQYGENNQLHPEEYYNGYIALFYWWGKTEVILMRGILRQMETVDLTGQKKWECVYPTQAKKFIQGYFERFLPPQAFKFAEYILSAKQKGAYQDIEDAKQFDEDLKKKLATAELSEECSVVLNDREYDILRAYFGTYYGKFFVDANH